ncbi:MAG: HAMP domain-containing protein [Acidobacteria bacterium]|nr:MAG: HAMP domain-containing protein [Acidobacteriota bacterium]
MNSLFLKIFLWFWLAMALVGAALVISIFYVPAGDVEEWARGTSEALVDYGSEAARIFEEQGRGALGQYLTRSSSSSGVRLGLYDPAGQELTGRAAFGGPGTRAARRAIRSGSSETLIAPRLVVIAHPVTGPSGRSYALVGAVPRRLARTETGPWDLGFRILGIVLTAGLVCYGLARYLTSPLMKLQRATRGLAQGDLDTRVGESVGRRSDEFADLARDFDLMADRIQHLVLAQRRLLQDISHELRSPLSRLNVALELARKSAGQEAAVYLDRIETEAERMNHLIGELLTLSRLESQGPRATGAPIALHQLLERVVADADFEASGLKRSVRLESSEECQVTGSLELLTSAVENVVRNAIRYAPEDSTVEVTLANERRGSTPEAVISIRDRGPGVPEDKLQHIFEPFYRVDDARDRRSGGMGLGLAIAGRAVELHGGSIAARNTPGGGLLVEIRLPVSA